MQRERERDTNVIRPSMCLRHMYVCVCVHVRRKNTYNKRVCACVHVQYMNRYTHIYANVSCVQRSVCGYRCMYRYAYIMIRLCVDTCLTRMVCSCTLPILCTRSMLSSISCWGERLQKAESQNCHEGLGGAPNLSRVPILKQDMAAMAWQFRDIPDSERTKTLRRPSA